MSVYTMPLRGVTNNLTALAGGAYANATPLATGYNEVDTVVTTADSLMLPPAIPGSDCLVNMQNTAAGASAKILGAINPFNGNVVDSIIAHTSVALVPGATGLSVVNGHASLFICTTMGQWKQIYDI